MSSKVQCNRCGRLQSRGKGSLPDGRYRCQPCRREDLAPGLKKRRRDGCAECGADFISAKRSDGSWTACCSRRCAGKRRMRLNPPPIQPMLKGMSKARDPYFRRANNSPGLSGHGRKRLLDRWRKQGRGCCYCDGPCETVEHLIPLKRGGTNYEGNLAPCCRACNGSKGALLVIEWKLKRGDLSGKRVRQDDRRRQVRRPTTRAA